MSQFSSFDKSAVVITEKPEWISYDDIHDLLWRANENNRSQGFLLKTSEMTGEKLRERIGEKGKCFTAVVDGQLIGTSSYRILERDRWYCRGPIVDKILSAILPEYTGCGVSSMLHEAIVQDVKAQGYEILEFDTAESNSRMQQIDIHRGFKYVSYFASAYTEHYSVVMACWLNGCPYSDFYCNLRFQLSRFKTRLRYKPGHVKRLL